MVCNGSVGACARVCLVALGLVATTSSSATELRFERWVDSTMAIPGGEGLFFLDAQRPAVCELGLVFQGLEPGRPLKSGIYRATGPGQVEVLVDDSTPIPGWVGTFSKVENPLCRGRSVVFKGFGAQVAEQGLYLWEQGQVHPLVTWQTPSPHGASHLTGFASVSLDGRVLAFEALDQISARSAVFTLSLDTGQLRLLAAEGDAVPERPGTVFLGVGRTEVDGEMVAFAGGFKLLETGLYLAAPALSRIADATTPVPGQPGQAFRYFVSLDISEGRTVFAAETLAGSGLYQYEEGVLSELLPPGTVTPEGVLLRGIDRIQLAGSRYAFFAGLEADPVQALYLARGASLEKVIQVGAAFDGQNVLRFEYVLVPEGLALLVWFFDSSQALYVGDLQGATEIPTLDTAGLATLALVLMAAGWWTLRRSNVRRPC
jgi:hypothetical protein